MDPAGVRELLLVRPYSNNPYQIETVIPELAFKARARTHYSVHSWIPLHEPLTQRVSRASEGYAGYLQYDAMVLAGCDLASCSERDIQNMRSAVERGLPVMLIGGNYGLSRGHRHWHDLESALPGHVVPGESQACNATVQTAGAHPILNGLPRELGRVRSLSRIETAPDAVVLLEAEGQPVMVGSERCGGRQLILAVDKAEGLCTDPLADTGFYGHPFYGDLMRQSLSWMMKVHSPVRIEQIDLSTGLQTEGDQHRITVRVVRDDCVAEGIRLRWRVWALDEARLTSGGEARRTELVAEDVRSVTGSDQHETFTLDDPAPGRSSGVYDVSLCVEMDDPPKLVGVRSFAMATPPNSTPWRGTSVQTRSFRLRFTDRRRSRFFVPGWTCSIQTGDRWEAQVQPDEGPAEVALRIEDESGATIADLRESGAAAGSCVTLAWQAPALTDGDYRACVQVARGGCTEQFQMLLRKAAFNDPPRSFHLVSHLGHGTAADGQIEQCIEDYYERFGMDVLSTPGMGHAETLFDPASMRWQQPLDVRRVRWLDAAVTAAGRLLWTDWNSKMVLLETHGFAESCNPTKPCVNDPGYREAVREYLETRLRLQSARTGLLSTEITDEPHYAPSNVCRCALCQELYQQRYGETMPEWEALIGDRSRRRWQFYEWMEEYTTRAFAVAYEARRELDPELRFHNVPIDRLFSSNFMYHAMHRWAAYGDELHMACYPWSYLNWRGGMHAPHSQTRFIAAYVRGMATHHDKRWGVFMELWEHDIPNRHLPVYWSVAQLYSLLAQGSNRLDTFYLSFGAEVFGISWPRLLEFGHEVKKIRPFFPLIGETERPRARLAFVHPYTHWIMEPAAHRLPPDHESYGFYRRYALPFDELYPHENRRLMAYELASRAFGDVDLVDEALMIEKDLDYSAMMISDCRFLLARAMDRIEAYVRDGGMLVLDCEPRFDEHGVDRGFIDRMTAGEEIERFAVIPGMICRVTSLGQGRVIKFSASLQWTFADTLDAGKTGWGDALVQALGRTLADGGARARWGSPVAAFDVGLRLCEGAALVAVANLLDGSHQGPVWLNDMPWPVSCAADLTNGGEIAFEQRDGRVVFDVALENYHGLLVGLFPGRPDMCEIKINGQPRRDEPLDMQVRLYDGKGKNLMGDWPLQVQCIDPTGREQRCLGGSLIARRGVTAWNPVLPVNAPSGKWQVKICDPVLGIEAVSGFDLGE